MGAAVRGVDGSGLEVERYFICPRSVCCFQKPITVDARSRPPFPLCLPLSHSPFQRPYNNARGCVAFTDSKHTSDARTPGSLLLPLLHSPLLFPSLLFRFPSPPSLHPPLDFPPHPRCLQPALPSPGNAGGRGVEAETRVGCEGLWGYWDWRGGGGRERWGGRMGDWFWGRIKGGWKWGWRTRLYSPPCAILAYGAYQYFCFSCRLRFVLLSPGLQADSWGWGEIRGRRRRL